MPILAYQDILAACKLPINASDATSSDNGVIRPCLKANVKSAGYDLRLGDQYYLADDKVGKAGGCLQISTLNDDKPVLVIPSNRVLIATTMEHLELPPDLVGHLSLKLDLLLHGLIMSNQSQIDAGYSGGLFILLYNLSSNPVNLHRGDPVLRLELSKLAAASSSPYHGTYQGKDLAQALKAPVESSLRDLHRRIDRFDKTLEKNEASITTTQVVGSLVAVAFLLITGLFTYLGPLHDRLTKVELQLTKAEAAQERAMDEKLKALTADIVALRQEIKDLRANNVGSPAKKVGP
jgi:deoxycytidine triphosphate deaminase